VSRLRWLDAGVAAGVAAGVVARVARYVDGRSLWNDEAQLALNVWGRDALALLEPLDFGQSAPYGFLLLERLLVLTLGPGELALRALPLLASLAALPLFAALARSVLPQRDAQIALLLFATCEPLVFYASELKPYSLDVLVALGLTALAVRAGTEPLDRRSTIVFAGSGALAPWLSFPAVFVSLAVGAGLAARHWRRGRAAQVSLALIAGAWLASLGALYGVQLASALGHPYLREFWTGAFAPMPPLSLAELAWYPRTLAGFWVDPVGLSPWWISLPIGLLGAGRLVRARPLFGWWVGGPLVVGLLASMLELYPLRTWPPVDASARLYPLVGRLWLFAVPAALLWVAHGLGGLAALAGRQADRVLALGLLVVVGGPLVTLGINAWDPPPVQEFRPIARQLGERLSSSDHVWVQRGSEPTFEYYARLLALSVRAQNVAASEAEYAAALERDLDALEPGERVWLVALEHPMWTTEADRRAIAARLRRRASEVGRLEAHGASAVEYVVRPAGE